MENIELLKDIKTAYEIVVDMIGKAKEQGAKNYEALYTLRDGLEALTSALEIDGSISRDLYNKWKNRVMFWIPRFFEGHPLLDKLIYIDNKLAPK